MRQKVPKRQTMFEDHPNWPVTSTQGESVMRFDTTTFFTLSPSAFLTTLHSSSKSATSLSRWVFRLLEFQSLFRHTNELNALELLQLSNGVFVNWADEGILEAFSLQDFKERRVLQQLVIPQ